AVAQRYSAREEVWFPGMGVRSTRESEDRFGIASVRSDDGVPSSWRPYFRRMLAQSLADLQRVLPALDTRGLRVHFGKSPGRDATLALHDPSDRKSTRLNSSHVKISYAVFCLKKKTISRTSTTA